MSKHLTNLAFFSGDYGVQRYDIVKYPELEKWNEMGLAHFWRPEEVDVTKDRADYESLSPAEKHIFKSNLSRQIKLDTVQGREPVKCFLPLASLPEVENGFMNLCFQETIHSRSYTHILRNVLISPSEVFDQVDNIPEIVALADELNKYYDGLHKWNTLRELEALDLQSQVPYNLYEHKKAFWLAMISANALEGVRFYLSFVCSWAFMQMMSKMEGNATIIKLIARDENEHLKYVQMLLAILVKEDPDFARIKVETEADVHNIYDVVGRQEKDWGKYLFQYGDMLGLDLKSCEDYIDLLVSERMSAIGYQYSGNVPDHHPMPWVEDWITSGRKQKALQEAENDSYLLGITTGPIVPMAVQKYLR